jgi:hypothetical protein
MRIRKLEFFDRARNFFRVLAEARTRMMRKNRLNRERRYANCDSHEDNMVN